MEEKVKCLPGKMEMPLSFEQGFKTFFFFKYLNNINCNYCKIKGCILLLLLTLSYVAIITTNHARVLPVNLFFNRSISSFNFFISLSRFVFTVTHTGPWRLCIVCVDS